MVGRHSYLPLLVGHYFAGNGTGHPWLGQDRLVDPCKIGASAYRRPYGKQMKDPAVSGTMRRNSGLRPAFARCLDPFDYFGGTGVESSSSRRGSIAQPVNNGPGSVPAWEMLANHYICWRIQ